ncbi:rhodanese-like domain-containing protein [Candidatus Enterococcus ferrettii]|uniref:Rhodanese domain-containing protein n=1 Tax=Candidatus Enterococcus ferrettii TaxID=2815324 RepID=A0ABV0EJG2_9ENTE|nr:rhodanese-like domain-containing protein [Enterococcus sp. 665A]MBO1338459.1 rhodanese-like domain-containing protein [Enterococcus sp. 665A]
MYRSVTIDEFYRSKGPIIDVREASEYQMGHVPQAVNLPLSDLDKTFQQMDSTKEYYVICQSGARSKMACDFLSSKGYQVVNVMGGTSAWKGKLVL